MMKLEKTIASVSIKKTGIVGAVEAAKTLSSQYSGKCVFDRNGYSYHGKIKAFADTVRENGFDF